MNLKNESSLRKCPKCGFQQPPKTRECRQCGLIFAKYQSRPTPSLALGFTEPAPGAVAAGPRISTIWKWLLALCLVLVGVSFFLKDRLPDPSDVVAPLFQEPVQTPTPKAPFRVEAGDQHYTITPRFQYELHGLVVSYHHTGSWWDIYHKAWQDFLNIKDLCVVWGENIDSGVYSRMKFKSGSWTCWYQWPDRETGALFDNASLSNNHLLAGNPEINRLIMTASIGDQVHFKGYLAEYANDATDFQRGTSTTRTDTGNGACETVYIEDFRILKRANSLWKMIFRYGWWLAGACLILWIVFAVREPYRAK